jgi:hypothetical protein
MHENAYSSIYIFKIFSGGDTPGPPLTRGGEGTGGRGGEGKGRGEERSRGGERGEGRERKGRREGRGGEGKKGQGGAFPYFFFYKSSTAKTYSTRDQLFYSQSWYR